MNWYKIYGEKAVDMCGATEDIYLGIIHLQEDRHQFLMPRPAPVGLHNIDNQHFLSIKFIKTAERTIGELQGFWIPPHLKGK